MTVLKTYRLTTSKKVFWQTFLLPQQSIKVADLNPNFLRRVLRLERFFPFVA
jgi:hypothetical protein